MSPFVETILITLAIVLTPLVVIALTGAVGTIVAYRPHQRTAAEVAVETARERAVVERAELRRFYRTFLRAER